MLIFLLNYLIYFTTVSVCGAKVRKVTYLSTERPGVTFVNPKFVAWANATSRRYGRASPVHYFSLSYRSVVAFDNNITVDFYFYEWLSNTYKRGFVEMHFRWCDMIHKDKFFGAAMKQGKLDRPCPYPPDVYHLANMTVSTAAIPRGFPFTKGRIYANVSQSYTREPVAAGYVDMELKQMKVNVKGNQ